MASIFRGIVDVTSTGAQLSNFSSNYFIPRFASADATYVRIAVGSSETDNKVYGGNTPGVALWDTIGQAIGYTRGKKEYAVPGGFVDVAVEPRKEVGNVPADYISITNGGTDAICIAGIAFSFADGSSGAFSTNVAAACGAMWSNSETPVLGEVLGPLTITPKCVWIDRDGTNGIPHQGMAFHISSFNYVSKNLAQSYKENMDLMCKSPPRFHMYPQLITEDSIRVFPRPPEFIRGPNTSTETGRDKDPKYIIGNPGVPADKLLGDYRDVLHDRRRSPRPNSCRPTHRRPHRPLAEQLIISPHSYNSARELCEARNSFGHSFVSLAEQLFCDMTDKSLYHTCSDCITSCCFDVEETSFRACQKDSTRPLITKVNGTDVNSDSLRTRQVGGVFTSHWTKDAKIYDSVQRW